LQEELGIAQVKLFPATKFEYHLQCNLEFSEWEMDQVFVGWYDGPMLPNPAEVQDYRWVDWEVLQSNAERAELKTDEFNTKQIEITTNEPSSHSTKHLTLAPWFVYMLAEKKIITEINKKIGGPYGNTH
jgi:isopentenyldiphosphate isomerase